MKRGRRSHAPKPPLDWYAALSGTNQVLFIISAGLLVTALFFFTASEYSDGPTTAGFVLGVLVVFGATFALTVTLLAVPIAAMAEPATGGRSLSDSIVLVRGDFMNSIREAVLADKGETISLGGPPSTITALSEDTRDEVEILVTATAISGSLVERLPRARRLLQRTVFGSAVTLPLSLGVGKATELLPQSGSLGFEVFFATAYIGGLTLTAIWGPRGAALISWAQRVNALRSQSLPSMRRTIREWAEED